MRKTTRWLGQMALIGGLGAMLFSVGCSLIGGTPTPDPTEVARQSQATATAQARVAATATTFAVRATAIANTPAALQQLATRFKIELIYVPPGQFTMGGATNGGDEQSAHSVDLPEFWIGKTEVTNAQYRAFVEAGGYQQQALWTEAGWEWKESKGITQPGCWSDEGFSQPELPVVCVSWYEALAYVRWLAQETGLGVRLPTEAEWEKVARGADRRAWPWGNEPPDGNHLNYCDKNCEYSWKDEAVDDEHQYVAQVGSFPDGASPYGALDMAGNVWEWTSTLWDFAYPYQPDDGREELEGSGRRVARGGSWLSPQSNTQTTYRDWFQPGYRLTYLGLRVVVTAPR